MLLGWWLNATTLFSTTKVWGSIVQTHRQGGEKAFSCPLLPLDLIWESYQPLVSLVCYCVPQKKKHKRYLLPTGSLSHLSMGGCSPPWRLQLHVKQLEKLPRCPWEWWDCRREDECKVPGFQAKGDTGWNLGFWRPIKPSMVGVCHGTSSCTIAQFFIK